MGWREPWAWWNGPVNPWIQPTPSTTGGAAVRPLCSLRSWPIAFRDADGLRLFWSRLKSFAGAEGRAVVVVNGAELDSVEALLEQPDRVLGNLEFRAFRPVDDMNNHGGLNTTWSLTVRLLNQPFRPVFGSTEFTGFVLCSSETPWPPRDGDVSAVDAMELLDAHCRPMTRWERWRNKAVITKRSEAEFYADERARKVRWQSWGLGIVGGLIGALVLHWMGLK